jgi:hypothetical protein
MVDAKELFRKLSFENYELSRSELDHVIQRVSTSASDYDLYHEVLVLASATAPSLQTKSTLLNLLEKQDLNDETRTAAIMAIENYWPDKALSNYDLFGFAHPRNFQGRTRSVIASLTAIGNRMERGKATIDQLLRLRKLAPVEIDEMDERLNYLSLVDDVLNQRT